MEGVSPEAGTGPGRDRRVVIAVGGTIALAAVVAVIVLTGGSGDEASTAAPAQCIEAWNADPEALAYGQHNYGTHGYDRVQVTRLTEAAEVPAEGEEGLCAVIFGALELDTEPVAAGEMRIDGAWQPISLRPGVELTRVAELQAIAVGEANSSLSGEGRLVPYGG